MDWLPEKGRKKKTSYPPSRIWLLTTLKKCKLFTPQGPYILLGVSNGGNVAFEMAKQLQAQGQTVAKLILFGNISINAGKEAEVNLENEPALVRKHRLRLH